ncbi:hypothetical protein BHE74_00039464 [Ensete ventricosum]|nr:hypothetical protein BHE74_00039464 [Ensete ventricosum]
MILEPKEKDTPQPITRTVPTLADYINLQKLKIEGFLEQQSVIILVDGSTHNFMSSKGRPATAWPPARGRSAVAKTPCKGVTGYGQGPLPRGGRLRPAHRGGARHLRRSSDDGGAERKEEDLGHSF